MTEPLLRVPPATATLFALLFLLHLGQSMGVLNAAPFLLVPAAGLADPITITWLSYAFFHASWLHWATNAGMLLAFGSVMERREGPLYFAAAYGGFGVLAAVSQALSAPDSTAALLGASGAVCGVMGYVLWSLVPPRQRIGMAAAFIAAQPILAWLAGDLFGGALAWPAHIAGFVAGGLYARTRYQSFL